MIYVTTVSETKVQDPPSHRARASPMPPPTTLLTLHYYQVRSIMPPPPLKAGGAIITLVRYIDDVYVTPKDPVCIYRLCTKKQLSATAPSSMVRAAGGG